MATNNKATLPDLADHMGKVALNLQGQYTHSSPKYQSTHCICDALDNFIARLDRIGEISWGLNYDNYPR